MTRWGNLTPTSDGVQRTPDLVIINMGLDTDKNRLE